MHLLIQLFHQGSARRTARPEVLCSPGNPATVSSACAERRPVALRPTLSSGLPLSGWLTVPSRVRAIGMPYARERSRYSKRFARKML